MADVASPSAAKEGEPNWGVGYRILERREKGGRERGGGGVNEVQRE